MGRTVEFSDVEVAEAKRMVGEAVDVREFKEGLSVVLSVELGLTNKGVANVLQSSPATVVRMHGHVRSCAGKEKREADVAPTWGGRRRAYMTPEEEEEFLRPWAEQAETGGVLIVPPIHKAFEERVGRRVQPATIYRLLGRHGWRKIAPDNIHPKGDKEAQEAFKKGGSRWLWTKH
jgi:transposase